MLVPGLSFELQVTVERKRYEGLNFRIGTTAHRSGTVRPVARRFGCGIGHARYYKRKAGDPTWHCGSWGGARRFTYDVFMRGLMDRALWALVQLDPNRLARQYSADLMQMGFALANRK